MHPSKPIAILSMATLTVSLAMAAPAQSTEPTLDEAVSEITMGSPGAAEQQIREAITHEAERQGVSPEEMARQAL